MKRHPPSVPAELPALPGRFPVGELSVISEGSYRTSQDGDSIPSSPMPGNRSGTFDDGDDSSAVSLPSRSKPTVTISFDDSSDAVFSITEDQTGETGIFRNFRQPNSDVSKNKSSLSKLTAAAIACGSTSFLGYDTDDDGDDSDTVATKPDLDQRQERPFPASKRGDHSRDTILSSNKQFISFPTWIEAIPMWLKLAVLTCLLLVIGSVTIGIVASLQDSPSNDSSISSSSQVKDSFLRLRGTSTPSPAPSTSPSYVPTFITS